MAEPRALSRSVWGSASHEHPAALLRGKDLREPRPTMTPVPPVLPAALAARPQAARAPRALVAAGLACIVRAALGLRLRAQARRTGRRGAGAGRKPGRSPSRGGGYHWPGRRPGRRHPRQPRSRSPTRSRATSPCIASVNRPYHVRGKSFVPATGCAPFRQRGHGDWYGRRFPRQPTSSGEPYDMYDDGRASDLRSRATRA